MKPNLPLAILVDGKSASASEIVAGTLQDLDRAIVVGEESFGKGLVQQTKKLAYGTRMKVTVAKYYTPSGRCVQRLDYSHRDEAGEVHAMADSALHTFYTANGREVLEGRGVLPDVEVPSESVNYVLEGLLREGVLFDHAVRVRNRLQAPAEADAFVLSDDEWQLFVEAVASMEEVPYASQTLKAFEKMAAKANEELLFENNEKALTTLEQALQANVEEDLKRHATEVRRALEMELAAHLYNTTGEYQFGLRDDPVARRAVSLLETGEYVAILSGPASQD